MTRVTKTASDWLPSSVRADASERGLVIDGHGHGHGRVPVSECGEAC